MKAPRRFKWVIEIDASEPLVADGFDPANQIRFGGYGGELSALGRIVDRWATSHCRVSIVKAPAAGQLLKAVRRG